MNQVELSQYNNYIELNDSANAGEEDHIKYLKQVNTKRNQKQQMKDY